MAVEPQKMQPVTEEELSQLPHEAMVAFAARCALRVWPIIGERGNFSFWGAFNRMYLLEIEKAVHKAILFSVNKLNSTVDITNEPIIASYAPIPNPKAAYARSSSFAALGAINDNTYVLSAASLAASATLNDFELNSVHRDDYEFLIKMPFSKGRKNVESFYQRPIWPRTTHPENWDEVENNFYKALESINYTKLFDRYQSGGAAYINLPLEKTADPEKPGLGDKVGKFVEEQVSKLVGSTSEFVKKTIFSIVSHKTKPALDVERHAGLMAQLLTNFRSERGQFVGIFGQWGRGKTYFWEQVKKIITNEKKPHFVAVEFQAWKYQDTPASWAYLYEILANHYIKSKHIFFLFRPIVSTWRKFKLNMFRGIWKKPLFTFLAVSVVGYFGLFLTGTLESILGKINLSEITDKYFVLTSGFAIPSLLILIYDKLKKNFSTKAMDLYERLTKKVSFTGLLGTQAEIQKELVVLLEAWFPNPLKKRLLLFVDDIDRCDEEKIIQIVDALRVMLEDENLVKRMIVLSAVDERILKRAIIKKYEKLVDEKWFENTIKYKDYINNLTREYMDKLFITGIKLMQLTSNQMGNFFKSLTSDDEESGRIVVNPEDIFKVNDAGQASPGSEEKNSANEKTGDPNNERIAKQNNSLENYADIKIVRSEQEKSDSSNEFELEIFEELILEGVVAKMPIATPRQIRIWYYRYLLAMRLLEPVLEGNSDEKNQKRISSLVAKLIYVYGRLYPIEEFKNLLPGYKKGRKTVTVNHKDFKVKVTIEPEISSKVFEVLEMVIAY
ncbi:MAG: hypothetical protein HND50_08385 [Calditrichaeota bacterium]|nr:hypothetical protein [Calditrichota bacterium]